MKLRLTLHHEHVFTDACNVGSETAINIGYSCKLLTDEMEDIFVVDGETYEEVEQQMLEAKAGMAQQNTTSPIEGHENDVPLEGRYGMLNIKLSQDNPDFGGYALVINGHSLVSLLWA